MKANDFIIENIPGWGMDIDERNEPTYPIKNYTGDDHKRIDYERSVQQKIDVELLQSNERPSPSVVFGNTVPPSGLSGAIRRYAFKHSEDRVRHWIPLIIADRVNAVEGLIEDIKNGHLPNIPKERGWNAELEFNGTNMIKRMLKGVLFGYLLYRIIKK